MTNAQTLSQLVLIGSHEGWTGRSLASVMEREGYNVVRTDTGRRALELSRQINPDAIILEDSFEDISASDVTRALRDDPLFDHATPIILTAPAPVAHVVRNRAYSSGAWDFCIQPLDVEALLNKLHTFTRARRELRDVRNELLIEPITGLYSEQALHRWAAHLCALASRTHDPLTCVAVMPSTRADASQVSAEEPSRETLSQLAGVCRNQSRRSDVIGYLGHWQFAILAPMTDAAGIMIFVDRLREALGDVPGVLSADRFRPSLQAGYCTVPDFGASSLEPSELLRRAGTALRHAHGTGRRNAAFSFDDLPVH